MKLYTYDIAPNPRRVKLFMQYKGIELDTSQIDLGKGEQFDESFKRINPEATVPVLELNDGSILCECIAINLYLESLYPEKPLIGKDGLQRAQIIDWSHRIFMTGLMPVAEILRNTSDVFQGRGLPGSVDLEQIPALAERGRKRLPEFFNNLERHMQGRKYIVGDSLTMADIDAYVVIGFASWVKQSIPDHCPRVQSWYQRIDEVLAG